MKRVLILNVDSFVGKEVCRRFFEAKEYLIDGTLYHHQQKRPEVTGEECVTSPEDVRADGADRKHHSISLPSSSRFVGSQKLEVPADMKPFLNSVMPRHGEISDEDFRVRVLTYDIIIAVLEEVAFEADCTIKILRGTHYEVEKTFVLVSNVFTWTQTDAYEYEQQRAARRAEKEAARAQRAAEREEDDEFEEEEEEEEEEEQEMEKKIWTEEDYRQRYPDIRYHLWRELEHAVKHANSETLHTYVLWAGLPYGNGEDILLSHFLAAWNHASLLQYGDGTNHIPTIHVKDLSRIIYLVGSSYDTLEERYMFAVDQGNNTQADILQGIKDFIGGTIRITDPKIDRKNQVMLPIPPKQPNEDEYEATVKAIQQYDPGVIDEIRREHDALVDLLECERQLLGEVQSEVCQVGQLSLRETIIQSRTLGETMRSEGEAENITYKRSLIIYPPHGLENWFSAVDMRCETGAVLSLLEEEKWVSLGGFFANVDKIVQEFKAVHQLQPMRLVLSGPPLTEAGNVASKLAGLFNIPHLTLENVTASYLEHVESLKEELIEILVRRQLRREAARAERIRREKERAELARRKARDEEGGEEEDEKGEENEEEEDEGGEEEEEEEGEEEEGEEEGEEKGGKEERGKSPVPQEMVDSTERIRATITEAKLLQGPGDGDEEEEEEEPNEDEDEVDDKAAAAAQQVDEAERRRIAILREEYRFGRHLLTLRLINGEFPPPTKSVDDEEEEEEEEEEEAFSDSDSKRKGKNRKEEKASDVKAADEPPPTIRYLDEALAVMFRWRLRQDDCKDQGYIIESYPETTRQARLTFLADTEEQKEMQRPKLQKDRDEEPEPQPPLDANFPLPALDELDDEQRRETLDLMNGKTFGSVEETMAPTHDAFFPDCFIALTSDEATLQAQINATPLGSTDGDAVKDIYEQFTQYMAHNRPGAPPTESLICWFQTIVTEKLEDDNNSPADTDGEGGETSGKSSRKACVLFVPALFTYSATTLPKTDSEGDASSLDSYCSFIRWEILKNIGLGSCGPVIDVIKKEEEELMEKLKALTDEEECLENLRINEEFFSEISRKQDDKALEEERGALRYYQAREELASVEGFDSIPVDMYLMRYVLPSLTPLMAEVVRMRPEDPVTVLADALFKHKRQVSP